MRHSNSFSVVNGRLSSQEFGVGAEIKNAKSELYSKVTLWKMIQTVAQYYRARFICITNDVRKYNECHIKTTGMRRTSSRRSISLYPGQNERCTFWIEKFLGQDVQLFDSVYSNTNGQNHGAAWKIRPFLLNKISTVILRQDHHGKGKTRKTLLEHDWEKFQIGKLLRDSRKRTILVCVCGWYKNWLGRNKTSAKCEKYS